MCDVTLFDVPMSQAEADRGVRGKARRTDPLTSAQAAAATDGARTRKAILATLTEPLTAEEVANRLTSMRRDTVITAVSRLAKQGYIVNSGRTRVSSAGCARIVWKRTEAATFGEAPAVP